MLHSCDRPTRLDFERHGMGSEKQLSLEILIIGALSNDSLDARIQFAFETVGR